MKRSRNPFVMATLAAAVSLFAPAKTQAAAPEQASVTGRLIVFDKLYAETPNLDSRVNDEIHSCRGVIANLLRFGRLAIKPGGILHGECQNKHNYVGITEITPFACGRASTIVSCVFGGDLDENKADMWARANADAANAVKEKQKQQAAIAAARKKPAKKPTVTRYQT